MRFLVQKRSLSAILRWTQRALFACAFLLLGYCAFVMTDAWMFQRRAKLELQDMLRQSQSRVAATPPNDSSVTPPSVTQPPPAAGALIGELNVDRLGISVAVMEGSDASTLEHAAGHIVGTALPGDVGNVGIAAHRDTFFRPLRNIRRDDIIRVTTPHGEYRYRVVSTKIVSLETVSVLDSDGSQVLTLVTCYPFYYVGSAPDRFIVRAERTLDPASSPDADLQPKPTPSHL